MALNGAGIPYVFFVFRYRLASGLGGFTLCENALSIRVVRALDGDAQNAARSKAKKANQKKKLKPKSDSRPDGKDIKTGPTPANKKESNK